MFYWNEILFYMSLSPNCFINIFDTWVNWCWLKKMYSYLFIFHTNCKLKPMIWNRKYVQYFYVWQFFRQISLSTNALVRFVNLSWFIDVWSWLLIFFVAENDKNRDGTVVVKIDHNHRIFQRLSLLGLFKFPQIKLMCSIGVTMMSGLFFFSTLRLYTKNTSKNILRYKSLNRHRTWLESTG